MWMVPYAIICTHRFKFLMQALFNRVNLVILASLILGGQFHFEKPGSSHNSGSKYGCYGQPDRETTYYMANAVNGYQTLTRGQFERVAHLFPLRYFNNYWVYLNDQCIQGLIFENSSSLLPSRYLEMLSI